VSTILTYANNVNKLYAKVKQQFHFYSVVDRACNACMKWKWREKARAFTGNVWRYTHNICAKL